MGKKRSYPRAQLRAEFRDWVSRRRKEHLELLAGWIGITAVLVAVGIVFDRQWVTAVYAAIVVGTGLIYIGIVLGVFLVTHPHAMRLLRGAWGEDLTRTELASLKRRRHSWGHVDSLTVDRGDIDHVVVLRRGGVVAIDSKWRSAWSEQICADVVVRSAKAASRARGLVATQFERSAGRHRGRLDRGDVTALAVVWGPAQDELTDDLFIDGVHVVAGRRLHAWLVARTSSPLDRQLAAELLQALERWDAECRRRTRDARSGEGAFPARA